MSSHFHKFPYKTPKETCIDDTSLVPAGSCHLCHHHHHLANSKKFWSTLPSKFLLLSKRSFLSFFGPFQSFQVSASSSVNYLLCTVTDLTNVITQANVQIQIIPGGPGSRPHIYNVRPLFHEQPNSSLFLKVSPWVSRFQLFLFCFLGIPGSIYKITSQTYHLTLLFKIPTPPAFLSNFNNTQAFVLAKVIPLFRPDRQFHVELGSRGSRRSATSSFLGRKAHQS